MGKIPTHIVPYLIASVLSSLTFGILLSLLIKDSTMPALTVSLLIANQICWWVGCRMILNTLNYYANK